MHFRFWKSTNPISQRGGCGIPAVRHLGPIIVSSSTYISSLSGIVFNVMFALFSILKDSFSKEEYITRQELEERLQALQSNDEKEILIEEVKAENGDDSISVDNIAVGNTE